MKYILTSSQMQRCDANTMEEGYGVPSAVLMERAALSVVYEITTAFPDPLTTVLLACGVGNNGGDGLAMARLLYLKGYHVTVLFFGKEEKCSVEAARQLGIDKKYGIEIVDKIPERDYDVIVDAIFGIGLARDIGGIYEEIVRGLNNKSGWKVAVDIASGISADTGKVMGVAFRADLTATFGFAKVGQMIYPGAEYTGALLVEDIGIDEKSLLDVKPTIRMAEPSDLSLLPERRDDSNKGTYGKLLIFAGSYNMAGAAGFCARAAYRSGAGLVRVVTENENRAIIQTLTPEAILATYDDKTDMDLFVKEQVGWASAIVLGPGIGQSRQAEEMVKSVLKNASVPCLVDADGLNILSNHLDWIKDTTLPLVVTPHPGEMARLLGATAEEVKSDLIFAAKQFSGQFGVVTVLKDARTVICSPDGDMWINSSGNHGMATAGSGDVLSGITGALLGQNLPTPLAAVLGVMVHGMAGDAIAKYTGKTSMTAQDLIEGICEVMKESEK